MSTPMEVDSDKMKDPVEPQAKSVLDMIIDIRGLLPRVTSNKNQCKRIADRFNTISDEALKSMELHEDSELFKILKRGQILVQGYADATDITAREISNGDNRDEFKEFHEDLHLAWAKLGFWWSLSRVENSDLHDDAEMDMKEIKLRMDESISQSPADDGLKKRAQVVLEKSNSNIDEENMPSFLAIECKSADVVIDEVPVKPQILKKLQFENELPSHLDIDRKSSSMKIDNKRACREYERLSEQDPESEVGWVVVRPGKWLGCKFAFKVFKCTAASDLALTWDKQELLKEARSLVALQHPHVVRFVGYGHDEESCLSVMELMDGDLKDFMKKNGVHQKKFTGRFDKRDVINQIAKGMYYMHERDYVHGDLKCTNILVKKLDDRVLQVKIGDLRGSQNLKNWDRDAFDKASKIRRPRWTAPEAIANYGGVEKPTDEQLKRSDVYSFGMTCYEIVTGKLPFHGIFEKDGLLNYIREGRVEECNVLPEELDKDLKGMIRKCWSKEPSERPTFEEICQRLKTASGWGSCCNLDTAKMLLRQLRCFSEHRPPAPPPQVPSYVAIIPSAHLQTRRRLGQGSGGKVYEATWLDCTFAVKQLNHPDNLKSEVGTLIEVSYHPFVVQLIGLYERSSEDYWIVMECMDGNLRELVEDRRKNRNQKILTPKGRQPEEIHKENLVIITKIALGMVYLHSKGLVHRDLKPENVLVRVYDDTIDVKIVDFGESHLEGKAGKISPSYFDRRGTGFYRAPEVMVKPNFDQLKSDSAKQVLEMLSRKADKAAQNFDLDAMKADKAAQNFDLDAMKATDVYSFGMVCYKVLTGDIPYPEDNISESHLKVWNGAELYWPSNLDLLPDLKSLVGRCLSLDPAKRPTFEVICEELDNIFRTEAFDIL